MTSSQDKRWNIIVCLCDFSSYKPTLLTSIITDYPTKEKRRSENLGNADHDLEASLADSLESHAKTSDLLTNASELSPMDSFHDTLQIAQHVELESLFGTPPTSASPNNAPSIDVCDESRVLPLSTVGFD